jgi:hypothetical protein
MFYVSMMLIPRRKHTYSPPRSVLYVDDVGTSQETNLQASTACYRDNFTFHGGP